MSTRIKNIIAVVLALALIAISMTAAAEHFSKPEAFRSEIESLNEKQQTVLLITGATTVTSTIITALPGDAGTPIAQKLTDISGYLLIVLTAIFLEKYLILMLPLAACRILFPLAFALALAWYLVGKEALLKLAIKFAAFGLAICLLIPTSVWVSDFIDGTFESSVNATIENATETNEEIREMTSITAIIKNKVEEITNMVKEEINGFLEATAVMLVTSCVIPILVLVFFVWIVRVILGVDLGNLHLERLRARGDE